MKNFCVTIVLVALLLSSCSERNNPIAPTTPIETAPIYFGKIGSQRVYKEVLKWFIPFTDSAFLTIPDSLLGVIRLSLEQVRQGIVSIKEITQYVDTIPYWYYTYWHLPAPYLDYKDLSGRGTGYDLNDHLQAIYEGRTYGGVNSVYGWGKILEKSDSIVSIMHPYGQWPFLLKPLSIDRSWVRDEWQYYDSSSARWRSHNIAAKVIDKVNVTVAAGTFEAYKVDITMNWPDLSYTVHWKYEYYVPNIGLVLEETDLVESILTLVPGGPPRTITVRTVSRWELQSFRIIQ